MQPFFSSTRATIICCPTTNCRCSSGLSSSSGMVCQGMYCSAAVAAACLVTRRLARDWEAAVLAFLRAELFGFVCIFFFAIPDSLPVAFFAPMGFGPTDRPSGGFTPWTVLFRRLAACLVYSSVVELHCCVVQVGVS